MTGLSPQGAAMAPHPSGYPDAQLHDTASHEWRDICLARWICSRAGIDARRDFLARFRRRHGAAVADHLDALVSAQWRSRARWQPDPAGDLFSMPAAPANETSEGQLPVMRNRPADVRVEAAA